MRTKKSKSKQPAEQVMKDICRRTRRHFSAEDKIRIVLEGLRGDPPEGTKHSERADRTLHLAELELRASIRIGQLGVFATSPVFV